jgi:hypothetical protein
MTGICTQEDIFKKIQSKKSKGKGKKLTVHADGEILAEEISTTKQFHLAAQ